MAVTVGTAAAAMTYAVRAPSSSLLGPSIYRGSSERRSVALTFDDGPSESTEAVLGILRTHRVPATFFQCGLNVLRLPQVARAVFAEGHEIGNHSHTHARLYLRSRKTIETELSHAQDAIVATVGVRPGIMRPPFGARWFGFREVQRRLGLTGIMWTVIALDWKLNSSAIVARLLQGVSNGAILCLHDGRELRERPDLSQMLQALREIVPVLQDRGYQFETVSRLICPTN